jgi:hypothetical protein
VFQRSSGRPGRITLTVEQVKGVNITLVEREKFSLVWLKRYYGMMEKRPRNFLGDNPRSMTTLS